MEEVFIVSRSSEGEIWVIENRKLTKVLSDADDALCLYGDKISEDNWILMPDIKPLLKQNNYEKARKILREFLKKYINDNEIINKIVNSEIRNQEGILFSIALGQAVFKTLANL